MSLELGEIIEDKVIRNKKRFRTDNVWQETMIAPILIKCAHNSVPWGTLRKNDKITFDEGLGKESGAQIKFTKFGVNKNLIVFPRADEDHNKIMSCNTGIFNNEKKELRATKQGFPIIVKGLSYQVAETHKNKLSPLGIIDIVDLGNEKYRLNICKMIVSDKTIYLRHLRERIRIGGYTFHTEPSVRRPTQCYNCLKFDHMASECKNPRICGKCGSQEHEETDCKSEPKCSNCKDKHHSKSGRCKEFIKRKEEEIDKVKRKLGITGNKNVEQPNQAILDTFEAQIEGYKGTVLNAMKDIVEPIKENMEILASNVNVVQDGKKAVSDRVKVLEEIEEKKIDDTTNLLVNILTDYHNKFHGSKNNAGAKSAVKGMVNEHINSISDIKSIDSKNGRKRSITDLFSQSIKKLTFKK